MQVVFISLSLFLYLFCFAADIAMLNLRHANGVRAGNISVKLNFAFALAAVILSVIALFKTGGKKYSGKSAEILRSYICTLTFNIAATLCLVPVGMLGFRPAKYIIMIFTPSFFIVSAVIYFIRVSKIGFEDENDETQDNDEED